MLEPPITAPVFSYLVRIADYSDSPQATINGVLCASCQRRLQECYICNRNFIPVGVHDAALVEGHIVCPDCENSDNVRECTDCGQRMLYDENNEMPGLCSACYDRYSSEDEPEEEDDYAGEEEPPFVNINAIRFETTPRTQRELITRCNSCGSIINNSKQQCNICNIIANSTFDFFQFRYPVGIEIEGSHHRTEEASRRINNMSAWAPVHDGSIESNSENQVCREFVSDILMGDNVIKALNEFDDFAINTGFETNPSCGVHVHIGISPNMKGTGIVVPSSGTLFKEMQNETWAKAWKIMLLWSKLEPVAFMISGLNRISNLYCIPVTSCLDTKTLMQITSMSEFYQFISGNLNKSEISKYGLTHALTPGFFPQINYRRLALNLNSLAFRGSLEFRTMQGSMPGQPEFIGTTRVLDWIYFCNSVVSTALKLKPKEISNLNLKAMTVEQILTSLLCIPSEHTSGLLELIEKNIQWFYPSLPNYGMTKTETSLNAWPAITAKVIRASNTGAKCSLKKNDIINQILASKPTARREVIAKRMIALMMSDPELAQVISLITKTYDMPSDLHDCFCSTILYRILTSYQLLHMPVSVFRTFYNSLQKTRIPNLNINYTMGLLHNTLVSRTRT